MNLGEHILTNPFLYEINTRVWFERFSKTNKTTIDKIPAEYWNSLKELGIGYLWLMGIWSTNKNTVEKYCFEEGLVKEYKEALTDFRKSDVIGSPYSIDDYDVNPELGGEESLLKLKSQLNSNGLKLILDFIPNHFSVESDLIKTNPEIFLQGNKEDLIRDQDTFFELDDKIFAHGKDPYFSSWKDTIQINYFSEEARNIMSEKLQTVSRLCDGVRCDMAMLINNSVFSKTWETLASRQSSNSPKTEFWKDEIERIKKERNDFMFIAEAYWRKEYELQQFGFDYTYDKTLLDRLKSNNANEVKNHLLADTSFQKKSLRFLENHDEQRASKIFDESQQKAAAVITYTLYGMKLIYDGQLEGRQIKLPVQLGREPKEDDNRNLELFYEKLLKITSNDIFCFGNWKLIDPVEAWEGDTTYSNILSWLWEYKEEEILVIVNYAGIASQCSISIDTNTEKDEIIFHDILNEEQYIRATKDINNTGLYIDLHPFGTHIFLY